MRMTVCKGGYHPRMTTSPVYGRDTYIRCGVYPIHITTATITLPLHQAISIDVVHLLNLIIVNAFTT